MAVDDSGDIHVVYRHTSGGTTKLIYKQLPGGNQKILDQAPSPGGFPFLAYRFAIAIHPTTQQPIVGYSIPENVQKLKTRQSPGTWSTENLDQFPSIVEIIDIEFFQNDIALLAIGNPDNVNGYTLTYSTKKGSGKWSEETIATQVDWRWADLEFKSTGVPWVTYSPRSFGVPDKIVVAQRSSQRWNSTEVAKVHRAIDPFPTMAIDSSDDVWLAFQYHGPNEPLNTTGTYTDLALATQNGSGGWTTHFVDSRAGAGFRPGIQIDNTGKIRVLYAQGYDLVYGTYAPSTGDFRKRDVADTGEGKRHIRFQPDGSPVGSHRTSASSGQSTNIQILQ